MSNISEFVGYALLFVLHAALLFYVYNDWKFDRNCIKFMSEQIESTCDLYRRIEELEKINRLKKQ